jgi:O-antigen/teichoic acid export membrane protein
MRVRIANGLADASLASLATFAAALFAARTLDPVALGAYALVFAAFVVAAIVPTQLIFAPAEVIAVAQPAHARMPLVRRTLRLGAPVTIVAAAGIALWIVVAPPGLARTTTVPLTLTAILAAAVSPLQDHLRRMLHLAGESARAAVVSAVQAAVVIALIAAAVVAGISPPWVPFGALAAANVVSLATALVVSRERLHGPETIVLRAGALLGAGRWLMVVGLLPTVTAFAAGALVAHLAGPDVLGLAEAARVAGQPILVLTIGLSAVLGPLSMRAAQDHDALAARRAARRFTTLTAAGGGAYLLIVGHAWSLNPMAALLPGAYAVSGLVALTVLANMAQAVAFPGRSEMLGAERNAALAGIEVAGNAMRLAVAAFAATLRAFAIPAGLLVLALVRFAWYTRALSEQYGSPIETLRSVVPSSAD